MPYIITHGYRPPGPGASLEPHSRRAVATLEEAARAAIEELDSTALATVPAMPGSAHLAGIESAEWIKRQSPDAAAWDALRDACYRLSESGGTVGPLPDGTEIEVVRRDWRSMSDETGLTYPACEDDRTAIIDAYNAREVNR